VIHVIDVVVVVALPLPPPQPLLDKHIKPGKYILALGRNISLLCEKGLQEMFGEKALSPKARKTNLTTWAWRRR
jgi:hypothetical protein